MSQKGPLLAGFSRRRRTENGKNGPFEAPGGAVFSVGHFDGSVSSSRSDARSSHDRRVAAELLAIRSLSASITTWRCHTARGGSSFREGRTRADLGILHSAGLWLELRGDDAILQARICAEMAGRLMNLGKILVPASILTRAGPLTEEELRSLHDAMLEATRLLEGVAFDGPVIETLRQCQEHWDGSGRPNGLKEREIIPTARVLAVANAFVGLRSPRAYRAKMSMDDAMRILIGEIGTKFDSAVVAALVSHVENKGGRATWADLPAGSDGPEAGIIIDPR